MASRAQPHPALAAIVAKPIAHRGLHDATHVENSLRAAQAAIAEGYGIECDVQLSADGEAMVFHDETLDRLTDRTGPVEALTAAELATIALKNGGGDAIIPLPRFLQEIAGRVPLVIEIKSLHDGRMALADRTVAAIADYRGPVALKSFDPAIVARCLALNAPCPVGLVGPLEDGDPVPANPSCDFLSWNVGELARMDKVPSTLPLMSWTVRSSTQHAAAKRHGAQIVFEHYNPCES